MARSSRGGPGGFRFTLEMEPDAKNIEMGFSKWANLIDNWGPAFKDVVKLFQAHEKQHFETEGKSTGPKFRKLSEKYRKWKSKAYPGRPILVLRGTLRTALVKGGQGTDGIRRVTRDSLVVGIDPNSRTAVYARAHSRGQGRLPKRPPVRYDPQVHYTSFKRVGNIGGRVPLGSAIAQVFQVYIVKARKVSGLDGIAVQKFDWKAKRRGVMRLAGKTK